MGHSEIGGRSRLLQHPGSRSAEFVNCKCGLRGLPEMFSSGSAAPERGTAGHPISRSDSADGGQSDGRDPAGASWSAIPWGVVGMVALVIGFETFVGRNWLDFSDPVSLSWRYSVRSVPKASREREILCLGDSLIKHGVIPGVIEQETGRKTINLSAARAPALLTYFLLRRALDAGARPQALIIDAKPAVLLAGPEFNARYWQEVLAPRECVDLARMASSGSFVLSTIVGRLLPSLRGRLEVRSNVLAALKGENDPVAAMNRVLWRNWTVNDGANVASPGRAPNQSPRSKSNTGCIPVCFMLIEPMPRQSSGSCNWPTSARFRSSGCSPQFRPTSRPAATRAAPRRVSSSLSDHSRCAIRAP